LDLHTKIEELNPILADCPYIFYVVGEAEDEDAFGSAGCNELDAILCIKRIVKRFNLNPFKVAVVVEASLAKDARQN